MPSNTYPSQTEGLTEIWYDAESENREHAVLDMRRVEHTLSVILSPICCQTYQWDRSKTFESQKKLISCD